SPASDRVLETGAMLARASGTSDVHVVTGYRPLGEFELARLTHDLPKEFRTGLWSDQTGEAIVADACARMRSLGVEASGHPVPGKGADAVLQVAADVQADLIVVGSHGYGPLGRVVHRSVSSAVTHHAGCSTLVVRSSDEVGA
ncbi:MAG: hypothetical protein RLZZ01_18, partial [Actinomycetota bacterium]